MGEDSPEERRWFRWVKDAERILGFDLDGDQEEDGYSLDFAGEAFDEGKIAAEYAEEVRARRLEMGLGNTLYQRVVEAARAGR